MLDGQILYVGYMAYLREMWAFHYVEKVIMSCHFGYIATL